MSQDEKQDNDVNQVPEWSPQAFEKRIADVVGGKTPGPHRRFTVTKTVRFEAAHRLTLGYKGKCRNIHGHSWEAKFYITAPKLDALGMVKDFSEFAAVKTWINDNLDHALILNEGDRHVIGFCREWAYKLYLMPGNPTSENLARELHRVARSLDLDVLAVQVAETCTSTAVYEELR